MLSNAIATRRNKSSGTTQITRSSLSCVIYGRCQSEALRTITSAAHTVRGLERACVLLQHCAGVCVPHTITGKHKDTL